MKNFLHIRWNLLFLLICSVLTLSDLARGVGIQVERDDNDVDSDTQDTAVLGTYIVQFKADATVSDIQKLVSQFGVSGGSYAHITIKECADNDITSEDCKGYLSIGDGYKALIIKLPTAVKDGKLQELYTEEVERLKTQSSIIKLVEQDQIAHIAGTNVPNSASRLRVGL